MNDRAFVIYARALRLVALLTVAAVIFMLFSIIAVPRGAITVSGSPFQPAAFISEPMPAERLVATTENDGQTTARLINSPIYVDATPPGDFDSVLLTARYFNRTGATVELGARTSYLDNQYALQPVDNSRLDIVNWSRSSSGRLTLLQREKSYASVDEFLRQPPAPARVAVWRAEAAAPFRQANYVPQSGTREMSVSLRGRHRLWTYVRGEPLHFSFFVQDMNRVIGADPVIITVYRDGSTEPLARTTLADDGNELDNQRSSGLRMISVSLTSPAEGAYQVEFTAPDDVFIRRIQTRQSKVVFADRLYVGDLVGFSDELTPVNLFVSGSRLTARTAHAEGEQILSVGSGKLEVTEPNTLAVAILPVGDATRVVAPRRDVLLETDGWFALEMTQMFAPRPWPLPWDATGEMLAARGIDFVLTTYEPPERDGLLTAASASFDLDKLVRNDDGSFRFAIVTPGLVEYNDDLRLVGVDFSWQRNRSGWLDAWLRLGRLWRWSRPDLERVVSDGWSFGEDYRR